MFLAVRAEKTNFVIRLIARKSRNYQRNKKIMSKATNAQPPRKVDYNDAVAASKAYFDGDDLAATVWVSKYALKDSFGNIYETSPAQMHERIAAEIERIERNYPDPMSRSEIYGLLDHFRYVIPQGGPMTGIGNDFQVPIPSDSGI